MERDIYVSSQPKKTLPKIAVVVTVLILLLGIGGFYFEKNKRERDSYEGKLVSSLHNWNEAKNLRGLNDSRSLELAAQAKTMVEELKDLGVEDARLSFLIQDMENVLPQISGEYRVTPRLVLDLALIAPEFSLGSFASSSGRVVLLDTNLNKVVSFDFEGRDVESFDVRDVARLSSLAIIDKSIFVRDGQRIARVDDKESVTVALSDGSWGEVIFVHGFGGNLYVGDRQKVWKYTPSASGGFGGGQDWLSEDAGDLYQRAISEVVGTALDGSLWVLGKGGETLKLTQGKRDYFTFKNLEKSLSAPQFLHTREDLEKLYILDSGNKRIVVFDKKSGDYQAQYLWDGMTDVRGIAVSEEKGKMLFLTNSKVYGVEM